MTRLWFQPCLPHSPSCIYLLVAFEKQFLYRTRMKGKKVVYTELVHVKVNRNPPLAHCKKPYARGDKSVQKEEV